MSQMSVMMSVYCTASKITLLQWCMMSGDPPGVIFLEFFCLRNGNGNGNTCQPVLCAGEAPDEKLKFNKLGPNVVVSGLSSSPPLYVLVT